MDSKKQLNAAQITFRNAAEQLKGARDGVDGKKFFKSSVLVFLCSRIVEDTKNTLAIMGGISKTAITRFNELTERLINHGYNAICETVSLEEGRGSDAKAKAYQILLIPFLEDCADFLGNISQVATQQTPTNGKPTRKRTNNKRGKQLTSADIKKNKGLNLVLDELRRRAKAIQDKRGVSFTDALSDAYEAMSNDTTRTTATWRGYFYEVEKKTLIDKVKHRRKYTVLIS